MDATKNINTFDAIAAKITVDCNRIQVLSGELFAVLGYHGTRWHRYAHIAYRRDFIGYAIPY